MHRQKFFERRWSDSRLDAESFASEIMGEVEAEEDNVFGELLCATPEELEYKEEGAEFDSRDFCTISTKDDIRPAWWRQWVDTCREQKGKLRSEILEALGVTVPNTEGASKDTGASEQDLKRAIELPQAWKDLVPYLHSHYSKLHTQLVKEGEEPPHSLDLRTDGSVQTDHGRPDPVMITFNLEARLSPAQGEADNLDRSSIRTEFFGIKNGHDHHWTWHISDL